MKKSNDTIGNRTRDLPACSTVPQPTALPRAPQHAMYLPECKYSIKPGVTEKNILAVHSTLMISRNYIDLLTVQRTVLVQLLTVIQSG